MDFYKKIVFLPTFIMILGFVILCLHKSLYLDEKIEYFELVQRFRLSLGTALMYTGVTGFSLQLLKKKEAKALIMAIVMTSFLFNLTSFWYLKTDSKKPICCSSELYPVLLSVLLQVSYGFVLIIIFNDFSKLSSKKRKMRNQKVRAALKKKN